MVGYRKIQKRTIKDYFCCLKETVKKPQRATGDTAASKRRITEGLLRKLLRKCAEKRWNALIVRIGECNGLRTVLGAHRWASFVEEARLKHYDGDLGRFEA